jgi:ATP-dependent Clp protease ATP-binding subunit ClpC
VVIFDSLEREDIHKIIDIELSQLYERIKGLGYKIIVTEKAKDFICDKGWDAQFGARPLKRAIQKYIEDALAEEIIKTKLVMDDIINIDYDEDSASIKITVAKPEPASKEMAKSK